MQLRKDMIFNNVHISVLAVCQVNIRMLSMCNSQVCGCLKVSVMSAVSFNTAFYLLISVIVALIHVGIFSCFSRSVFSSTSSTPTSHIPVSPPC